jgi:hypothetical protein
LPDLPDLPDWLLAREPEGLELVLGAEGREKLRDDEGVRPNRTVEDLLERGVTREGLRPVGRDKLDLLTVELLVCLETEGLLFLDLELRDSNRAEGRGTRVLRSGIAVLRSLDVDSRDPLQVLVTGTSRDVLQVLVTGTRFLLVTPTPSLAGEGLSTLVLVVLVETGFTGEDVGDR